MAAISRPTALNPIKSSEGPSFRKSSVLFPQNIRNNSLRKPSVDTFGGRKDSVALGSMPVRLRQESIFKGLPFEYIMPLVNQHCFEPLEEEEHEVEEDDDTPTVQPTGLPTKKAVVSMPRSSKTPEPLVRNSSRDLPMPKKVKKAASLNMPSRSVSTPPKQSFPEPAPFVEDWRDTKALVLKAPHLFKSFEDQELFLNAAISQKLRRSPSESKDPVEKQHSVRARNHSVDMFTSYTDLDEALKVMPAGSMAHATFCYTNARNTPFLRTLTFGKNERGTVYSSGHGLLFVPNRSNPSEVITQQNIGLIKFVSYSEQCDVPASRQSPDLTKAKH